MTYAEFIDDIIADRGQWGIPDGEAFEGHHIVPKCLGGKGDSSKKDPNVIWLTPQEHYEAHKLLALEHPTDRKLTCAWHMMAFKKSDSQSRGYEISAEDSALAKKLSNAAKSRPVICIETGERYDSCAAAERALGDGNVCMAANGKRNRAAGYHWAYADDEATLKRLHGFAGKPRRTKAKAIICIETGEKFEKVIDAADRYRIGRPSISYCLIGETETAGGLHWAYSDDAEKIRSLSRFEGKAKTTLHERQEAKFGHRVLCIELGKAFPSAKAAAAWINASYNHRITSGNVMYACRGLRKTTAGFHWEFEKENG